MSRQLVAEGLGSALLLYVIVGSGIAAGNLGGDATAQLLSHALVVGLGLGALVAVFQNVSGSHFNPSVTVAFWRAKTMSGLGASGYIAAQVSGALAGVVLANLSFALPAMSLSDTVRDGAGRVLAEGIATFVLVLAILALVRTGRSAAVPVAVGAWVATIVFATASTGFANPAVTIARMLTNTYTGIAPSSVGAFVTVQVLAGVAAAYSALFFYSQTTPSKAMT